VKKVLDVELTGEGIKNISLAMKKEYTLNCYDLMFAPAEGKLPAKEKLLLEADEKREKEAEEKAGAAIALSALGGLALALLFLLI